MKTALFIPCYVNQFYPQVGIATYNLLEKLGVDLDYPTRQTCCGQPMANSGHEKDSIQSALHFVEVFKDYDNIVAPSGSCVHFVREHYDIIPQNKEVQKIRANTFELTEFLLNVLKIDSLDARFPHKVGIHNSCHAHRGLSIGKQSELHIEDQPDNIRILLSMVKDIELIKLDHYDECCGFGGTFAVVEEAVSVRMGLNRIEDHRKNGSEIITGVDMSCLMHMEGLIKKGKNDLRVMHLSEILVSN